MREQIRDKGRLEHILECVNNIYEFVGDFELSQILDDKVRYFAIVYQLVVIGEASNLLTTDFRDSHGETPWRDIISMRNFIVHGYNLVDKNEVLQVIEDDLPVLKAQIEQYLSEIE
ncbi:MAG: DUF86 domain-containing protein [Bacteroidales bacterium]|nr:DUF86 domain-containing protein [Bacteroidales bacterium]